MLARAILLPVLLMALLAGGLGWGISHLLSLNQSVGRSDQANSLANHAYRLLVDQETGLRGYALTAAPDFLEPYRAAEGALRPTLANLRPLVRNSPEQVRRVDELLTRESSWHQAADRVITATARGEDTRPIIRTRQGKQRMDEMRTLLAALIREEEELRNHQARDVQEMVPRVLFLGGGLTLLFGVLLAFSSVRTLTGVSRTYKQSLCEREESEARLGGILGSAMDAIITVDAEQRVVLFNAAAERMFGRPSTEALGGRLDPFLPERYRDTHRHHLEEFGRTGATSRTLVGVQLRALRASGEEFPIEATISQVEVQGQKLFTAVIRDISGREQAERELRGSQALFSEFMENSPALAFIRDAAGRLVYANAAYERFTGIGLADLEGKTVGELVPKETAQRLLTLYERVLIEGRALQESLPIPTRDGRERDLQFYLFPIAHTGGERVLGGLALDISEQRTLEGQLRQSQKMEAVGRLAGGVAHDFNNMLAVIIGYSELVLDRLPPEDPLSPLVGEVMKAGERAASLTRQLLAFSRQQIVQAQLLDLNQVIAGLEGMLQRLIGEDVELVAVPASLPALVMADPGQLEQIVLNLAINSRDAMPHGGKLTIEVCEVELDESYAREHHEVTPGPHVLLAVSDTGGGMDAATQARMFEPFFTTKETGQGTGLGLATVFGIVKQSGGSVWVYSELGQGTTFKVYFPKAAGGTPVPDKSAVKREFSRGGETVLLLEDDPLVRGMVRSALEASGYQVLEAARFQEALQFCGEPGRTIDLLLTDVVMPQMSGRKVVEQVRQQRPGIKVLFMSGYTDDAVVRHGVLHAEEQFIQKPFALGDLTRKLREILDA